MSDQGVSLWQRLVNRLKPGEQAVAAKPAGPNKRAWVRYPSDKERSCQSATAKGQLSWAGKIKDVSRGGIRLVIQRRFEVGTLLNIAVQNQGDSNASTVLARVLHVSPQPGNNWSLGCAFSQALTEEELQTFL